MMSMPLGILMFAGLLAFIFGGGNAQIFLNMHSFVFVVGGTFAAGLLATPWNQIRELRPLLRHMLYPKSSPESWIGDLVKVSDDRERRLENSHPLISYAQELWIQGVDENLFSTRLRQRSELFLETLEGGVMIMRNLAKYPPALGMTGTVIGMVEMFSNLNAAGKDSIGANIAIAMTATFYGLILANFLVMPLADRLASVKNAEIACVESIFKTLLIVNAGELITHNSEKAIYANAS